MNTDFANPQPLRVCTYCGCQHDETCPRIAAIDYYPNGQVKRVELRPARNALKAKLHRFGGPPESPVI